MVGLGLLLSLTLACFFLPPVIERTLGVNAYDTNVPRRYKAPGNGNNILGTDDLGRDQLLRLLYGGRVSLSVAFGASVLSLTIGVLLGLMAGYYGGLVDDTINWFLTTLSSIPSIFLLILIAVIFTPSPGTLVVLLGLLGWIDTCRLVRGEVLSLKEREYIVAARAVGVTPLRVMAVHLLPNLISLLIVTLTIGAGTWILVESGLSYLGLGVRPPTPTWGNMLTESRKYFTTAVHLVVWPGVMIVITVLCFYIVGDGLRDAFDPRTRSKGK
jgi:peptide/nickel transport system permease protein